MSVCQRSAQGAKAPQRPPAEQAEPLTAHHRIEKRLADAGRFFVAAPRVRTRRGAELSKRVSVCQRSAQGAKAPQRPPAEQAEPLTAHHRKESDRLRLVAFFVAAARVRTRTSLYIRTLGEQNLPFTDGKQMVDGFGVKWRSRDDRCLNTYKPAGHRQYQKLLLRKRPQLSN